MVKCKACAERRARLKKMMALAYERTRAVIEKAKSISKADVGTNKVGKINSKETKE